MFRTKLLLILPLVAAVTVGQANRGYSDYGTSNVRDLLLPRRPMPVTGPVTAAPAAPMVPAPVLDGPLAPAAPHSLAAPSYVPVRRPRSLKNRPTISPYPIRTGGPLAVAPPQPSAIGEPQPMAPAPVLDGPSAPAAPPAPVLRPLLPPSPIRPARPLANAPPQSSAIGEPQPPVTAAAPPLPPVEAHTPEAPILPEPAVEQPEHAPISIPASQPGDPVVVELLPAPIPTGEPAPVTEQPPAPEPIQPSTVVSEPLPQPEPISQPEPIRQPEPISQPEPIRHPEPISQPEPIRQPEPISQPEPIRHPEPISQPESIRRLEPISQPEPIRQPEPPMIYYPTVTYPTQTPSYSYSPTPPRSVATQAPKVVVTTQSYPAVTQAPGQLKFDFQCKEGNGYYSVEHECDTYIECKQNRAMKYTCPNGLHFNPAAKHFEYPCAYPSEVKCMPGDQEQNPKPTAKCPNQYGFYSMNDGDCSQFIMCHEGLATIMSCPRGLAFNPHTSACDWPANVPQCNPNVFKDFTCPAPPKDEDGKDSDIIYKYRYEGKCKLYIACQLGHPRLLSCERGLSFDDASQTCIDEDYVTDCSVPV